jgi:outer membrane lipoprotein SlyB
MSKIHILLLSAPLILLGCASDKGGDVYSRDQVREVQHFKVGTVESVHKVRIEGTKSPVGTTAGTIVGGIAGSGASGGKTGEVAAVLGAVVGGLVGSAAEEAYTRENGIEMAIKLESGEYISVVQAVNKNAEDEIKPGDKVRVIESDGVTRVAKF